MTRTLPVQTKPCRLCGESGIVLVTPAGLESWQAGELIQRAMPELSASEREQLMTGIHGECWDQVFGEAE